MTKLRNLLARFQLQYLNTPRLALVAIATSAAVCVAALAVVHLSCRQMQQRLDALQQMANQLTEQNQDLTRRIENLGTAESIRQIAREELGMVDPDVIIIEEE